MSKSQKQIQLFINNTFNKIVIFEKKGTDVKKNNIYFRILKVPPVILTSHLTV